jgi:ferric-dicitrate binding protein FerR (iron transport regulator)
VLRAGDRAVLDPATGQTEKSTVNTKAYVAWKDGTLFFEDQPLAEVLPELERWYGVRFVVDNPAINACRITAKFDNLPLATLLDQVQFIVPITYRLEEKQIHLSGESCAPEVR